MMNKKYLLILFLYINTYISNKYNKKCSSNKDCISNGESYSCLENYCKHKAVSLKNIYNLYGLFILLILNILSSIAGVGSGSILVSLLLVFFDFNIDHAIPMAKLLIFSSSIINSYFIMNIKNNNNKIIVDFNLLVFSIPFLLIGTIFGVLFNNILPTTVIHVILWLVLFFSLVIYIKKYLKKNNPNDKINEILEIENEYYDIIVDKKKCIIWNLISLFIILIISFLKYYIYNNNPSLLILFISIFVWLLLGSSCCYYKKKVTQNFNKKDYILALVYFISGIASGSLGIGGSTIITPVLLYFDYSPILVSGVTGYTILYSSCSTSFQYYLLGAYNFNLIYYIIFFALIGSIVGKLLIRFLFKKSTKFNFIVLIIFILNVLSLFIILIELVKNLRLKSI